MRTSDKLRIIQRLAGLTQTKLAERIGVSFVAFNRWRTGKVEPRQKQLVIIDELYREYTGQKQIPVSTLSAKKSLIQTAAKKQKSVLKMLLKNSDLHDQFLLSLTYHSNKIEGSTLSEGETADIMFHDAALADKSLVEQLEVKNHQTALQFLFRHLAGAKPINEALISKLHAILMNGIRTDAGDYRRHPVRIVGAYVPTTNYLKIPESMKNLAKEFKKKTKDVIGMVTRVHSRFEQIHPFSDGNGRVGRLLMCAMLLKNNLAPAIIRQEKKRLYYAYLNQSQIKNDQTQLEDFVCDAVLEGFQILARKGHA